MVPLLVLVGLLVVQAAIVGAALVTTESAARSGARAASLCDDGEAVARKAPPGWLRDGVIAAAQPAGSGDVRMQVDTRVPILFTALNLPSHVRRAATFPVTGDC